jgi:four helix bundle protein
MDQFDHEKLDVYQTAVDWVSLAQDIADALPRGKGNLADQLQRASSSITLNIAEGAGEFSGAEKARFYRIAKRSATECAAILDVAKRRSCISDEHRGQGRSLLLRIVGMLVKLARSHS